MSWCDVFTRSLSQHIVFQRQTDAASAKRCATCAWKLMGMPRYTRSSDVSPPQFAFPPSRSRTICSCSCSFHTAVDSVPVKCPFEGPFKFSYSRGHGECRDPLSSIDSCTDDAHLLFRFQACADVQGSESRGLCTDCQPRRATHSQVYFSYFSRHTVEQLECIGEWKEGSVRYLVGKLQHIAAKTDEDKYRCFVFEKMKDDSGYQIAQSGDATCDGIFSPTEGSRTMKLTKTEPVTPTCFFPPWLSAQRHWQTLDRTQVYDFSRNNTFRVFNATRAARGTVIRQASCARVESSTDAYHEIVIHSVAGW